MSHIKKEFNIDIPLKEVFGLRTIRQQAEFVETNLWLIKKDIGESGKIEVLI